MLEMIMNLKKINEKILLHKNVNLFIKQIQIISL